MNNLDATVSMLEAMPEDARIKVMEFTQRLFTSREMLINSSISS